MAAEEQFVTHSALTKSIRRLEEQLGLRLFDRTTRSVEPTAAAAHLIRKVESLLAGMMEFERETVLLKEGDLGEVRIGAGVLPIESIIAPALGRFAESHPSVQVDVLTGDPESMIEQLLDHRLDIMLYEVWPSQTSKYKDALLFEALPPEPIVLVFRPDHPVAGRKPSITRYLDFPWASPSRSPFGLQKLPEQLRAQMQARALPRYRFQSLSACLALVEQSDVIAAAPRSVAKRLVQQKRLKMSKLPFLLTSDVGIYTVARRTLSPAAEALVAHIRDVALKTQRA